eukprot:9494873-Pyramimonas_sp.AAC.1
MTELFDSCVTLSAQLTDTDPATYPASGTPFGPELTDLEDGQGGPRGEVYLLPGRGGHSISITN